MGNFLKTCLLILSYFLKEYDPKRMFETAEEFFTSIGLYNMTDQFWNKTIMSKPEDRDIVCHASAWNFFAPGGGDFRFQIISVQSRIIVYFSYL